MSQPTRERVGPGAEAGFTLVEALVAVVVLVFGLMAVTNLMLVAASSNSVANQSTAAVASATRAMDMIRATTYDVLDDTPGGETFDPGTPGKECADPTLVFTEWRCHDDVPGVGTIHTQWWVTAAADPRWLAIRVRSEGTGALAGARSRAEFTTFRSCTNAEQGCPEAP